MMILVAIIVSLGTVLGMGLAMKYWDYWHSISHDLVALTAGFLIALVLVNMMPEALAMGGDSVVLFEFFLGGFVVFYLLSQAPMFHICSDHSCEVVNSTVGVLALVGMILHSLLDGVVIATSFAFSSDLGILVAVGIFTHKLAAGFLGFHLLQSAGFTVVKSFIYIALLAVATPLGSVLFTLVALPADYAAILLAMLSGGLFYVAGSDLLPRGRQRVVPFLLGLILVILLHLLG